MKHMVASGDLGQAKAELRAAIGARRLAPAAWLARRNGRRIAGRLVRLSAFRRARLVLAYVPVRGEADPGPALRAALRAGARVALPRVAGPRRIEFHVVEDAGALVPGAFGIPEPPADPRTRVDPAGAGIILVPGMAFGMTGERVGYGGGFYDAFLRVPHAPAVGVGFELQVLASVPAAAHDIRLDALVTEARTRLFGN